MNPYESQRLLSEYLLFHFGKADDLLGGLPGPREAVGFAQRCVNELVGTGAEGGRALDVGCAVGGSSFELAKICREVTGVDFSRSFIKAAQRLAAEGSLACEIEVEAGRRACFVARVPEDVPRERVRFAQGDAMALDSRLAGFDVVLAANLLCRLRHPQKFLQSLPRLVRPGGQLLLTTPFTWLEDFTPRHNWLGQDRSCWDELCEKLEPHFVLEKKRDLPFLIREHARKFQYGIALASRWRAKN